MLNWWRIATETLNGSCDATFSRSRKPYLVITHNRNARINNTMCLKEKEKISKSLSLLLYLLANFWCGILVG